MVNIIKDRDLILDVYNYDVILVGVNIYNSKGNGFQYKVHKNFPKVYETHRDTPYSDKKKLGKVFVVPIKPIFCLCYISKGRFHPYKKSDAVEYESLEECLRLIAKNFPDKKIASTIMGNSSFEGGGDKERIIKMFEDSCGDLDVTLYDYEQEDYHFEGDRIYKDIVKRREENIITKEQYYEEKKKFVWERAFGIYKPMPENVGYRELRNIIEKLKKENDD